MTLTDHIDNIKNVRYLPTTSISKGSNTYKGATSILASAVTLTTDWQDIGSMQDDGNEYNTINYAIDKTDNDSTGILFRLIGNITDNPTKDYVIKEYSDYDVLEFKTKGFINLQLQSKASVVGASAGTIDSVYTTKYFDFSDTSTINPATADKQDLQTILLGEVVNTQKDASQKTQLVDSAGNVITSAPDADGDYHLGTALIQKIVTSTNNSTTDNLASGATFTGVADETFGVNGIQLYHASDQNCTIYLDQSIDDTFADSTQTITDSFSCLANDPCSRTYISVAPYYRLRITNNGSSATTKLASYTAMTPVINPLPRSLSDDGRLMSESTLSGRENTERHVWVNPTNELAVSPVYRMVGTNFDGDTKDPNFWTDGSLRDGTVTQSGGEIELETNTTANGLALYQSVRKSRFVAGSAQYFNGGFNFVTAGTANNRRLVGACILGVSDVQNGFYFQLNGTTFSVGYARDGVITLVNSGSFNGNLGVNFVPTADTYYSLTIEFTPLGAFWYVGGKLLHKVSQAHMSDFMTLPITILNENTGDSTTDVSLDCVGAYIARQGELQTNPTSYFHAYGAETGATLKYGAGVIHTIIFGSAANNAVVTIIDSTTAATPVLWEYDATGALAVPISVSMGGLPFSDGLRIIVSNSASFTIVYE